MANEVGGGLGGQIVDITERLKPTPSNKPGGLKGGGGDGTSGGMESRIARLESDMEHVKKAVEKIDRGQDDLRRSIGGIKDDVGGLRTEFKEDVGSLRTEFGRFDERSKHFPTKGFIFSVSVALLAAGSAIMAVLIRVLA